MAKYRKKPVVVEAERWYPDAFLGVSAGCVQAYKFPASAKCKNCQCQLRNHGWIKTLEGGHIVCPGDWIITGVQGEKYPCKPDIFEQTYEKVEEDSNNG